MSTTSLLDRFLDPVVEFLPADAARKIIELRIDPELQTRLDELAEKANEGTLSADERNEYEAYIDRSAQRTRCAALPSRAGTIGTNISPSMAHASSD